MRPSRLGLCALLMLTITTLRTDAVEQLKIDVSPMHSFAPSTLTVSVRMPPNTQHRRLEIAADSGGFYRSSQVQLDGKDAPSSVSVQFRSVPGGDYTVTATVTDGSGRQLAQAWRDVTVFALGEGN